MKAAKGSIKIINPGMFFFAEAKTKEKNACTPIIMNIIPPITAGLIPSIVIYAVSIIRAGSNIT